MTSPSEVKITGQDVDRFKKLEAESGTAWAIMDLIARRVPDDVRYGDRANWRLEQCYGHNACRDHMLRGSEE